jgi:thiol:disulfide interchange protein
MEDQFELDNQEDVLLPIIKGIIGALIGAIPGILVWELIAQAGFIAALSGIVLAFGVIFGYKLFKGYDNGKIMAVICGIIMILAVFLSVRMEWSFAIVKAFKKEGLEATFSECFSSLSTFLELTNLKSKYILSMVEGYAFAGLGVFVGLKKIFRGR